jgi:Mitochondrial carrier protein
MLFQGFTATALRDAPYAGVFLVVYEGFKHRLGEYACLISQMILSDLSDVEPFHVRPLIRRKNVFSSSRGGIGADDGRMAE